MLRVSNSAPDAPRSRGSDRAEGPGRDAELCASVTAAIDRHVAVACADEHGRITFANRAFCRLSGYTRDYFPTWQSFWLSSATMSGLIFLMVFLFFRTKVKIRAQDRQRSTMAEASA